MSTPTFRPLLLTQSDVERMWRRLMSPLGFSRATLWMIVVEGDRPEPQITEIIELRDPPAGAELERFADVLRPHASPTTRFAFLRSRPGSGTPDATDLAWARALYAAGRLAGARLEVVHLAHDHDVLPLAMDDLLPQPDCSTSQ